MAFGKDKEALRGVSPFGAGTSFAQRTAFMLNQQNSTKTGRGGGGGMFQDVFKPTKLSTGFDVGRLVPGSYAYTSCDKDRQLSTYDLEYWPYVEHFNARNERSTICSGGVFHNFKGARDECLGCDQFFKGMTKENGKTKKGNVSKRDMYAFNFLHYHRYHKTQQRDKGGQIKTNNDGEPYMEWVQCEGRTCQMCKMNLETVEAKLLKWPMGFTHFKAMTQEYGNIISNSCKGCGTKNSIVTVAWLCPHEGCGEAVIDLSDTTMSDDDIAKIVNSPVICPFCKQEGFLQEAYKCNACRGAIRASIFDVDINVKRMENSKDGGNQTTLIVSDYSEPRPIDARYAELAKALDLPKIYAPSALDYQEKIFEVSRQAPAGQPVQPQGLQRTPVAGAGFRSYAGQNNSGS